MHKAVSFAVGMSALLMAQAAYADVIYDNGGPNQSNGNEMTEWIQAENFTLAADATVTGVTFWDIEEPGAFQGSISWIIFADNSGTPGTQLASGNTLMTQVATGNIPLGLTEFEDSFALSFDALGGTTYWLGLHNGPLTTTAFDSMFWEDSSGGSAPTGHEFNLQDGGPWNDNGTEHAFQLSSVPEPGTILLIGCGLTGLALIRRRA
jgi:hypothetical protein